MPAPTADTLTLPRMTPSPDARIRRVKSLTTAPGGLEGEGFPVRRAFAGVVKTDLDPFVHMDQMGEVDCRFIHEDSNHGGGTILEGGTQYMTAGDGILHIETPPADLVESGGLFHGVQLWINLPIAKKRIAPQYQDLQGQDSAMVTTADGGTLVRILAGEVDGHQGPGISHTPLAVTHVTVAPGARADIPWRSDFNALAYVLAGSGTIGADRRPFRTGQLAVLVDGDTVRIEADTTQDSRTENLEVFLIGGVPLREPVVQYGPFVMSTDAEIREAFEDYQRGRLGTVPAGAIQPHRAGQPKAGA